MYISHDYLKQLFLLGSQNIIHKIWKQNGGIKLMLYYSCNGFFIYKYKKYDGMQHAVMQL